VRAIDATANPGGALWAEQPCRVAGLRALLAEATPDALAAARRLAETFLHQAENVHRPAHIIQDAALLALVWRALRRTPEALAALDRALALAAPRGFVRTFLDLGAPMTELLQFYARGGHGSSGGHGLPGRRLSVGIRLSAGKSVDRHPVIIS
jgi:LuxR family maltose regulon positive regulatory protein